MSDRGPREKTISCHQHNSPAGHVVTVKSSFVHPSGILDVSPALGTFAFELYPLAPGKTTPGKSHLLVKARLTCYVQSPELRIER